MRNFYVKAKTKKRWGEICKLFDEAGIKWRSGEKATEELNCWDEFGSNSVIEFCSPGIRYNSSSFTKYIKIKFKDLRNELGVKKVEIVEGVDKIYTIGRHTIECKKTQANYTVLVIRIGRCYDGRINIGDKHTSIAQANKMLEAWDINAEIVENN